MTPGEHSPGSVREPRACPSQFSTSAHKELIELIKTTGTGLIDLHGIGPYGAARLHVEVEDVTRFPDRGHFASWTGTARGRTPASNLRAWAADRSFFAPPGMSSSTS